MDAVTLDVPYRFIQAVRLVHAVTETGLHVHVPEEEAPKFASLVATFDVRFTVGIDGVPVVPATFSHEAPVTGIGPVARPLIFPHGIVERCRSSWPHARSVRFSFTGLMTEERRALLEGWSGAALPGGRGDATMATLAYRSASRLRRGAELEIWSSRRGRTFPVKAWDQEYYDVLARSEFVLCPNGDFVWTYRFFEAILCGAIPVVEDDCAVYDGFTYHRMADDPESLRWDPVVAERNHLLAVERLTVPLEQLAAAVRTVLRR